MSELSDSSFYGKITKSTTNLMKKLFWENVVLMDENTLEPAACAWMVTLGDGMVPFRVLEYNLGIFQHFQERDNYCLSSGKRKKDIRKEEK